MDLLAGENLRIPQQPDQGAMRLVRPISGLSRRVRDPRGRGWRNSARAARGMPDGDRSRSGGRAARERPLLDEQVRGMLPSALAGRIRWHHRPVDQTGCTGVVLSGTVKRIRVTSV
jgi:hypothetical protein